MKISISGIRGIFGEDFGLYEISKFSKQFGSYVYDNFDKLSCVISRDSRPSGEIIANIVIASLLGQGINVYDLGISPTPVLFRESKKYDAAIMITASHNPLEWNGLKMLIKGRGLFEEELENILNNKIHNPVELGKYYRTNSAYSDDLAKFFPKFKDLQSDFLVGLDCGGGAACTFVHMLFQLYRIKYLSINDVFGFSNRSPDPTSDPLKELSILVKSNNMKFGFAFDLDGDRLVIVNEKGENLSPDLTLLLCVASAIRNNIKKFVISLDSSIVIEKYIKRHGCHVYYSKVGESNVIKKISETDAEAGGEGSSGGFIMPSFTSCRDGLLASMIICSLDKNIIEECLSMSSDFMQIRTKLPIKSGIDLKHLLNEILDLIKPYSKEIISEDGFKFIFNDDSWALVRSSNTEHVLRISLEAKRNEVNSLYDLIYTKIYEIYEKN